MICLDYRGPTIIDFNSDGDFEDWIKISQEPAKELKNMQVHMGGARFYKAQRGKVKSRLRVKPHFFGVFPEDAILTTPEEQVLFWSIQERFNPVDLKHSLETKFKQERHNPACVGPEIGRPWKGTQNPYARLVFCGLHGFGETGEFNLTHRMRVQRSADNWRCSKDYDRGEGRCCTGIRQQKWMLIREAPCSSWHWRILSCTLSQASGH